MNKPTKNILITFIIGCFIFLIGTALSNRGFQFNSLNEFLIQFTFYQLYSFVLGFSNLAYFGYLEKRSWEDKERTKRILVGIFGSLVITMIGLFVLRLLTAVIFEGESITQFISNETIDSYVFGIWITMTILAIFHFIYFYTKYQKRK